MSMLNKPTNNVQILLPEQEVEELITEYEINIRADLNKPTQQIIDRIITLLHKPYLVGSYAPQKYTSKNNDIIIDEEMQALANAIEE